MDEYPNISLFLRCFHSIRAKSSDFITTVGDDSLLNTSMSKICVLYNCLSFVKYFYVGDIEEIFNSSPQIKMILEQLFNEYKVIPALIEYFSKHAEDQGVLSAIEAFLTCTSFIRVVLKEKFDDRPLKIVAEERGGHKSLKADCEHEVARRYKFSPVRMDIWNGSVMGQVDTYTIPKTQTKKFKKPLLELLLISG